MLKNMRLKVKISLGFGIITLILVGSVLTAIWQTKQTNSIFSDFADIRTPTAQTSLMMLNGVNHSLAALRGWVLLGNERFKDERKDAWEKEINQSFEELITLSLNWKNVKNSEKLNIIDNNLANYKKIQDDIENIAHTINNTPATKLLLEEATPLANIIAKSLNNMIDIESNLDATPMRKNLLGMMADVRGTFGLSIANIRSYLISGKSKFINEYTTLWEKNNIRFNNLSNNTKLLSPEQLEAFKTLSNAREAFEPITTDMCEIRASDDWNQANKWLKNDAVPLAFVIKDALKIIVDNQKELMKSDLTFVKKHTTLVDFIEWILLASGISITFFVGFFITRSISNPIYKLMKTIDEFGNGNLDAKAEVSSNNEIGSLAKSFNRMATDLQLISIKQEEQNWLNSNLTNISSKIQTATDLTVLANLVISEITPLLKCGHSVFYIENEKELFTLFSSYGYKERKHISSSFKLREGLVGQCAFEKQSILLTQVPPDHIKITTGLGESVPTNILLQPVLFKNSVVGIIEFASFHVFTQPQLEFIDKLSTQMGNFINNIKANKTEELLKESQKQADQLLTQQEKLKITNEELEEKSVELQAQQKELKNANEELEQKTKELEAQSEEYQAQSEELRITNDELEQKKITIERAKVEIEEKANELEITCKYKSEFLSNMSHELRTPLNSMLILSKSLADNDDGNFTKDQIESATVINKSGNDLLNIINDILDLSKVEAGKLEVHFEDITIDSIKQDIMSQFEPVTHEKNFTFAIETDDNVPESIIIDAQRTEQVLKNLLSNAFKFTELGSVTLKIEAQCYGFECSNSGNLINNNAIAFSVIDTGIGIPEDKQAAIFEAFQQADGSTCRKYGGTGLGLTISKEMAKLMGGRLHMSSRQGKGSIFTLYLPLDPENKLNKSLIAAPTISHSKPNEIIVSKNLNQNPEKSKIFLEDDRKKLNDDDKTILVVEDDIHFARILLKFFRKKGYKCLVSNEGIEGISFALEYIPNAIILDMGLPDIKGNIVLDKLKNYKQTQNIPIHVISGMDEHDEYLNKDAIGFLTKPFDTDSLENVFTKFEDMCDESIKHILIVDNDQEDSKAIIKIIKRNGVNTSTACDEQEAIDLIKLKHFDCVILCILNDDIKNYELLQKLRENKSVKIPPIIIYTEKQLTSEEYNKLLEFTKHFVIKDSHSSDRLLDEVSLFLHSVESSLPIDNNLMKHLHNSDNLLNNRKILLVDDDMRNVFALTKVLKSHGLIVSRASDGKKALELLEKENDIELILMDIMMPIMNGYETMQKIRKMKNFKTVPIIALTAKAMPEDRGKCIEAGASDYLCKPVNPKKLLSIIKVWIYN